MHVKSLSFCTVLLKKKLTSIVRNTWTSSSKVVSRFAYCTYTMQLHDWWMFLVSIMIISCKTAAQIYSVHNPRWIELLSCGVASVKHRRHLLRFTIYCLFFSFFLMKTRQFIMSHDLQRPVLADKKTQRNVFLIHTHTPAQTRTHAWLRNDAASK